MVNPLLLKTIPYVGIAALLWIGKCGYDANQREIGAMRERLQVTSDSLKLVKARGRQIDSVFIRDTVRLTRRITQTQTLIDTLLHSDTVTLTRRESVLVFVADSLVRQCRETVQSCTELTANLRTQLSLVTTQRDAYRPLQPSGFSKARSTITAALIGAAFSYLLLRH